MKIRFFHQYFHPDRSSVSRVISQIAFHLAEAGHDVSVVCSRNRYDPAQPGELPARETVNGVKVRRCWGASLGKKTAFARGADMLSFCALAAIRGFLSGRVDVVVLLTNPPFFSALGPLLQRFRGERFVHVVMDLYPDIAVREGMLREGTLTEKVLRRISDFTLRKADTVVVLGDDMREAVLRSGARISNLVVIPNWADPRRIVPVPPESNRLRRELGLDGKFVVEYSGNMGVCHAFDDLLAVADDLKDSEEIRFLFIGGGERLADIKAFAQARNLENVIFLPYQDDSRLSDSLSMGDVHYVSLRERFEGLVVPSKPYGIMAAGRPMIYQGAKEGDVARMVSEEKVGLVVPPGDRQGLRSAILGLQRDRAKRLEMGASARQVLLGKYAAEAGLERYRMVLEGRI